MEDKKYMRLKTKTGSFILPCEDGVYLFEGSKETDFIFLEDNRVLNGGNKKLIYKGENTSNMAVSQFDVVEKRIRMIMVQINDNFYRYMFFVTKIGEELLYKLSLSNSKSVSISLTVDVLKVFPELIEEVESGRAYLGM